MQGYEQFKKEFGTDYHQIRHVDEEAIGRFFGHRPPISHFENPRQITLEELRGLVASSSFMPLPGAPKYQEMMDALHHLFHTFMHNGTVQMQLSTKLYLGSRP